MLKEDRYTEENTTHLPEKMIVEASCELDGVSHTREFELNKSDMYGKTEQELVDEFSQRLGTVLIFEKIARIDTMKYDGYSQGVRS